MKKGILLTAALVLALVMAGTAMACGGEHYRDSRYAGGPDGVSGMGGKWHEGRHMMWGEGNGMWVPYSYVVPQEIRDKRAEAQKTMIDLRLEMSRNPINREKALELYAKHSSLAREIEDWHFKQKLDALGAR